MTGNVVIIGTDPTVHAVSGTTPRGVQLWKSAIQSAVSGTVEVCKVGEVAGSFTFTISPGGLGPIVVPAGACSPPIEVAAGVVHIREAPVPGTALIACATIPASRQGPCDLASLTSTVTIVPGDVSTQTIALIRNRRSGVVADTSTAGGHHSP